MPAPEYQRLQGCDDVDPHGQDVPPLGLEGLGQIVVEAREAVGMPAEVLAVEPYVAIHVDAVELDPDVAVFRFRGRGEGLAIPADAAVEVSAAFARRGVRIEGAFDAPVVRHIELPPGRVVEIGVLAILDLAQMEPPIAVEVDGRAVARRSGGGLAAGGQEKRQAAQCGGSCGIHASAFQEVKGPNVFNAICSK